MKLRVVVDGEPIDLDLRRDGTSSPAYRQPRCAVAHRPVPFQSVTVACPAASGWRLRRGDGTERDVSILEAEPGIYSVLLDGESYEAKLTNGQAGSFVDVRGRHYAVEVIDPRRYRRRSGGLPGEGRQQLKAPMPGKVVRVLVSEGDEVEPGQGLVVVEAMKMQNEMKAPRAGRVVALAARAGATVGAGEVLAVLE